MEGKCGRSASQISGTLPIHLSLHCCLLEAMIPLRGRRRWAMLIRHLFILRLAIIMRFACLTPYGIAERHYLSDEHLDLVPLSTSMCTTSFSSSATGVILFKKLHQHHSIQPVIMRRKHSTRHSGTHEHVRGFLFMALVPRCLTSSPTWQESMQLCLR